MDDVSHFLAVDQGKGRGISRGTGEALGWCGTRALSVGYKNLERFCPPVAEFILQRIGSDPGSTEEPSRITPGNLALLVARIKVYSGLQPALSIAGGECSAAGD